MNLVTSNSQILREASLFIETKVLFVEFHKHLISSCQSLTGVSNFAEVKAEVLFMCLD